LYHDSTPLTISKEEVKKTKAKKRPTEGKVIFSIKEVGLTKKGVITPPVNQAAAIVLRKLDKARNWPILGLRIGFTILIILPLLTEIMGKFTDFLAGQKVLEKRKSKLNGEIKVIRNLAFGTYIQAGGITQSGGIVESIWNKTLRKIVNYKLSINNCLILGLGGGSAAKLVKKYWPKTKIVGIDIDPVIVELGRKYLGLNKVKIEISEASDWIVKNKKKDFDLVLIDVYQGREFPKKFEEEKFLKLLTKFKIIIFNRLYYGEKRPEAMKFGQKLEKVFKKVDYFYPQANLMFLCYNIE